MSDFLRSSSPWAVGDILPSPLIDPDPSPGSLGLAFISSHAVPAVATVATVFSPKPLWGSQETLLDFFLSWPLQRTWAHRQTTVLHSGRSCLLLIGLSYEETLRKDRSLHLGERESLINGIFEASHIPSGNHDRDQNTPLLKEGNGPRLSKLGAEIRLFLSRYQVPDGRNRHNKITLSTPPLPSPCAIN